MKTSRKIIYATVLMGLCGLSWIPDNGEVTSSSFSHEPQRKSPLTSSIQKTEQPLATEETDYSMPPLEYPLAKHPGFSEPQMKAYFYGNLNRESAINHLYEKSLNTTGHTESGILISIYIASGLYGSNESSFSEYMQALQDSLNENADEIYANLLKNEHHLKEDDFAFQMVLNLAGNLEIDDEKKARLLGMAFTQDFTMSDPSLIDFSSANITNALIIAKNKDLPYSMVQPYLDQGLSHTQGDLEKNEFLKRIQAYYPEAL